MGDDEVIPIGTFARFARVTVRALRHYHALGILAPARVDPASGYRYYRWAQLSDVLTVRTLRDLDIPLDEIRSHLVGGQPLQAVLTKERDRLERQAARATRGLAMIDQLTGATSLPDYGVQVIEREPITVVTATGEAHSDTLTADATTLIEQLLRQADGADLDTTQPVVGEYPASLDGHLTIRAHLPVTPGRDSPAPYRTSVLPGGSYGRVLHTGSLDSLPLGYYGLVNWLYRSGLPVSGPFFERYLDDPVRTSPAELRTEVLHRVD